ncbi:MAG: hypothetical protein EBR82_42465 [Caulobacteraceae bacterium]|nr:hypothetical protein [Caulobacteraceae bacterium]
MTHDEIQRAWKLVNQYGPPNSWTAANGTLAAALGRALEEIERLKYRVAMMEKSPPPAWLGRRD